MKIGDEIVCIIDDTYGFKDDLRYTNFFLTKNKIYTICEIYISYSDLRSVYVSSTTPELEKTHDIFIKLNENEYLYFDISRFVSIQKYRKLKLKKLNILN